MSSTARDARLIELVAAFTEMGPAWMRWVQAAIPDDTVSYARLRVLNALECHPDGLTMTKLAEALEVTGRRVTALVDALTEDGLVERYAHPTDGRGTIVEITEAGRAQQRQVWEEHQGRVAVAFVISPMRTRCACSTSATSSPRRFAAAWPNGPPRSSRHAAVIPTRC
jgi:DNA-binding MarR family transcriptional regulator